MSYVRLLVVASIIVVATPRAADAFCGFYVAGADQKLYNNATMVTLMRDGTTTVLSMRNNYQGPPEDFAMVVPVPVVLKESEVKTLPAAIFDRVDKLAAPRLVEYWEQDPCNQVTGRYGTIGHGSGTGAGYGVGGGGSARARPLVKVEAKFAVGEYDIVILSAEDATALEEWLTQNGYKIPAGASAHLHPYVQNGSKFFVAKVDPKKVVFKDGMANLSPLRFHYESKDFQLPIRLGLINAGAAQDLIVHILAKNQRYEVANYTNATIPTNLIVTDEVRDQFGEFYAALFDATSARAPRTVVTEYAWDSGTCDPCPEEPLSDSELMTLGLDVLGRTGSSGGRPRASNRMASLPELKIGVAQVTGELDPNIVRRYLRRQQPRMTYCYEKQLLVSPGLAGTVKAQFEVAATGRVGKVATSGVDPTVATCVKGALASIQFPTLKAGPVTVEVPLTYRTVQAAAPGRIGMSRAASGWVLTRLHARYTPDTLGEDLVFRAADPIEGGRGSGGDDLSKDARPSTQNMFQGRYIMRHAWTGAIDCPTPTRGVWGAPPRGVKASTETTTATNLAFAKRGAITLASAVAEPLAPLGIEPAKTPAPAPEPPAAASPTPEPKPEPKPEAKKGGCGCGTSPDAGGALLLLLLAFTVAIAVRPGR